MFPAKIHRRIYLALLTLLGGCMVTSTWASNLVWVLLGVNWLLEGRWREKWQLLRESRLLQAFIGLYLLLLAGMLWTENQSFGWSLLQVKLPLLCVPLVLLTTRPPAGRVRQGILWLYVATVLVVSVIGLVRMLTIPDLPYRSAVPYISHIRFALNCCMAVYLCAAVAVKNRSVLQKAVAVLVLLWLLGFILLLHSYTAVAILLVVSLVTLLAYYRRWPLIALWVLLVGGFAFAVGHEVHAYYRMSPLATAPLRATTASGNPYFHACDGIVENGNYVNNYISSYELRREWNRRSALPYDSSTASGYSVESTLVRYLNSLGLTKDSAGIATLTDAQLAAVERGVANAEYESGNPLRRMVYVMLFERENYVHTRAVAGFTMLQRLELWNATLQVIGDHPWLGVGTGDVVDAMQHHLAAADSELSGRGMRSHNQYLGLLAAVGAVGFALALFLFVRPLFGRRRAMASALMTAWLLTVLISMLTEDTLDTLAGILFCTWLLAFRPSAPSKGDTDDKSPQGT